MKKLIAIIIISLFSTLVITANGVDDQGQPNDPTINERANACYDEGSMADIPCTTDWEWTCGWHLIRWEANNNYDIPTTCNILLPVVAISEEITVVEDDVCVDPDLLLTSDSTPDSPVITVTTPTDIFICGVFALGTATIQAISNSRVDGNLIYCEIAGLPYEAHITWTNSAGSYTEIWTGNCLLELPT